MGIWNFLFKMEQGDKMKRLTKKQAISIAKNYNLGEVKSFGPVAGGWVNYNYLLRTDKGKFVVRILGSKIKKETIKRLGNEFKLLEYLHQKEFPYQIPYPLKNMVGDYLTKRSKQFFWVYPYLEGSPIKDYENKSIRSIVKALATYHKYIEKFKLKDNRKIDSVEKTAKKYKELKKLKPLDSVNNLMLENIGFFEESLNKLKKINFNTKKVPIHYDFHKGNLLFDRKNVVGILDFERMLYAPRILDIAHLIKCTYKKNKRDFLNRANFIVNEYNKVNTLTEREKELILPLLAIDNCRMFNQFYHSAKKGNEKKGSEGELACLRWTINVQRLVTEVIK
jgi:homoserine kinase type II